LVLLSFGLRTANRTREIPIEETALPQVEDSHRRYAKDDTVSGAPSGALRRLRPMNGMVNRAVAEAAK
jgi:hypothetical protein